MVKKSATKPELSMDAVEDAITTLDRRSQELEDAIGANDVVIAGINAKLTEIESLLQKKTKGPLGVTNIDGNQTFQRCIEASMSSIVGSMNIMLLMKNPGHMEAAVNNIIYLAECLHEKLCDRYKIEA